MLKAKYHVVQEYAGLKHSNLGMSLNMSEVGVCFITIFMFIVEVFNDVEKESRYLQHRAPYS